MPALPVQNIANILSWPVVEGMGFVDERRKCGHGQVCPNQGHDYPSRNYTGADD